MKKINIISFIVIHLGSPLFAMEQTVCPIPCALGFANQLRAVPFEKGIDPKVYIAQLLHRMKEQIPDHTLPANQSSVAPTIAKSKVLDQGVIWGDYTPDGQSLIVSLLATNSLNIGVFNAQTLELKKTFDHQASELKASPNNREIAVSLNPPSVSRFDIETGKIIAQLTHGAGDQIHYNNDGSRLLIGQGGNGIYDMTTNQKVVPLPATSNQAGFYGLDWNPADNNQIVTSDGKSINIFDVRQNKYVETVVPPVPVGIVHYNNSGTRIACSAAQQFIACDAKTAAIQAYYDLTGNKSPNNKPFPVPQNPAFIQYFLNFVPEVAAGSRDIIITSIYNSSRNMIGFDLDQDTSLFNIENVAPIPGVLVVSPDGKTMAEVQVTSPQIQIWDISAVQQQIKGSVSLRKTSTCITH